MTPLLKVDRPEDDRPVVRWVVRLAALAGGAAALTLAACATARTVCPAGTELARRIYSGGGEAEWCRRPDGVRQGPETRYYESGIELVAGDYVDGTVSGVWRYRFNNGRNWRADRWEDGALLSQSVDPAVATLTPTQLEELGPTSSGIIKLLSVDPVLGREMRARAGTTFVGRHANGRPQVIGSYDGDGLRTGIWRFWYADGRPEREVEYLSGVRERSARAWHPNGQPAADGFYVAGEREGLWRWWDARGQTVGETSYVGGKKQGISVAQPAAVPATRGGMLAP